MPNMKISAEEDNFFGFMMCLIPLLIRMQTKQTGQTELISLSSAWNALDTVKLS